MSAELRLEDPDWGDADPGRKVLWGMRPREDRWLVQSCTATGDTAKATSKSANSQFIMLSLAPNWKVAGGLMYRRLKLAPIPLGLRSFSKNEPEEVRMQSLSSHTGAVGGARALSSRPGRESCGQSTKEHLLKHFCVPSLELGRAGPEGALRCTPHTALSLQLVRQI